MNGIPTYTQRSVAWPSLSYDDKLDDVGVSFDAFGGGTHGEFRFDWVSLKSPSYPYGACRVVSFSDGIGAMLDGRVLRVIRKLGRTRKEPTPAQVIAWLEAEGVRPSLHHLRGLLALNPPHAERVQLERQLEAAMRRERGER